MCIGKLSIWWWAKVITNLAIIAQAVYRGLMDERAWLSGLLLLVGQLIVFVGAAINLAHFVMLKQASRAVKNPNALLTDVGFFQVVRHPMYLGELILVFGVVLLCFNWLAVLLYLISVWTMTRLCLVEDAEMAKKFGNQHVRWVENTQVLLPKIW